MGEVVVRMNIEKLNLLNQKYPCKWRKPKYKGNNISIWCGKYDDYLGFKGCSECFLSSHGGLCFPSNAEMANAKDYRFEKDGMKRQIQVE